MSFARGRAMFQLDLGRGDDRAALNARFLEQAATFRLAFQCPDCVYVGSDGRCTVGWPNEGLLAEPLQALDAAGDPVFCKSFEADDV